MSQLLYIVKKPKKIFVFESDWCSMVSFVYVKRQV